jgi:phytanoyl-CoA hydroxylase
MSVCAPETTLTQQEIQGYERDGYHIARALFTQADLDELAAVFASIAAKGEPIRGHWAPNLDAPADDPLARHPRVMHPHRFDPVSRRYLLDSRIRNVLVGLLGEEPIAAQSMFYYKPPGSRGQAFHQDNFYLNVKPGSCIAAWVAIDPSLAENGGLWVVPGTQGLEIVCPNLADDNLSFTTHLVNPPPGLKEIPVIMEPGDCLFFNGSLIHGSQPNRHPTLWRRSFICHYMPWSGQEINPHYFPLLRFNGEEIQRGAAPKGGACGEEFANLNSYGRVK